MKSHTVFLWLFWSLVTMVVSGCSSTANVTLQQSFPRVVAQPRDVSAAIIFDKSFQQYIGKPNKDTTINIGAAQVDLLTKAFSGLFSQIQIAESEAAISGNPDLVIKPQVVEVQLAVPSDTYLNVYEVWIKYKLEIYTSSGTLLDGWFMPAYGKTQDSFMLSKSEAIRDAANIALRDAGAKLILDFYRVPAVQNWLANNDKGSQQ